MELVRCGRIGRPHGVRGELRLWVFNQESALLRDLKGRELYIGRSESVAVAYRCSRARNDAKGLLLTLEGLCSREEAAALTNAFWFLDREAFTALESDEFYLIDLIGLPVFLPDGEEIGRVSALQEGSAYELIEIRLARGGRSLVPLTEAFFPTLRPESGALQLVPIPGLLPLSEGREEEVQE
ncbi:MAG: ribosome maturation factor RimM [Myxococcota bacterium]|nr:ribosome maturation factor RimM [Myxococcota bacterium]